MFLTEKPYFSWLTVIVVMLLYFPVAAFYDSRETINKELGQLHAIARVSVSSRLPARDTGVTDSPNTNFVSRCRATGPTAAG